MQYVKSWSEDLFQIGECLSEVLFGWCERVIDKLHQVKLKCSYIMLFNIHVK